MSTFKELAENEYYKMLALKGGVAEVDVVVRIIFKYLMSFRVI